MFFILSGNFYPATNKADTPQSKRFITKSTEKGGRVTEIFKNRPLFTACMLFVLTAVIFLLVSPTLHLLLFILALCLPLLTVIILLAARGKSHSILCVTVAGVLIALSCLSSYSFFQKRDKIVQYYGTDVTIEALILSTEHSDVNFSSYRILVTRVGDEEIRHKAILECRYESVLQPGFVIGHKVSAKGFDTVSGSYNEELSMLSDGIFISYESEDASACLITEEDQFHISIFFNKLRDKLSRIFTSNLDGEVGNLSAALLLGNKDLLSRSTTRDFARAGVSHILALSGMHMTIVIGVLGRQLRWLTGESKLSSLGVILIAIFYLLLTGCSISATRAVIILIIQYLSLFFSGESDELTVLSIAAVIILLVSPGSIADAGFWLSFSATFGLLTYAPVFHQFIVEKTRRFKKLGIIRRGILALIETFVASFIALIPMIAVMCLFIKEMSLATVLSSFLMAIPTALLLLLSMFFLPFASIPVISEYLGKAIAYIGNIMLAYCRQVSDIQGITFSLNYPFSEVAAIIITCVLILTLIFKAKTAPRSLLPFALSIVLLFGGMVVYNISQKENVSVTYHNVSSQSDMLVVSCNGKAVICDIGNGSNASFSSALDTIYEARATEIEAIMLTRYSYLHNAHLSDLFQSEKVRRLWLPYPANEDEYYKMVPLKEYAEREGIEVYVYRSGDDFILFDTVLLNSYRTSIDRSSVPISIVTVKNQAKRLTYYSPAFNEAELTEEMLETLEASEYLIFGNKGPITKADYTIPSDNDAELIVFADETRAAYFRNDGIINTAYVLVPDKIRINLTQ